MRKVCFFTGSRADYGIMSSLIRKVCDDAEMKLQIIATNMHLSPEYGLTYQEIEKDGFAIDKKIEMLLSSNTDVGTVKSMGVELIGIADALKELDPDILVVLGDRYETLMAAAAAEIIKIPIAHLYGGEVSEGAYDDSIRHAVTKLSSLHFTSTEEYRKRVIQMGEDPERVFWVGSLGVENLLKTKILSKKELENSIAFALGDKSILVTFHPVTIEDGTAEKQIKELLSALDEFPDYRILFTFPNSDGGGRTIREKIEEYVSVRNNSFAIASLGKSRYYAALKYVDIVVGNSSSGLVEAPTFNVPTLNIGNRQKGRTKGKTVIDCNPEKDSIVRGIKKGLSKNFKEFCVTCNNPYAKPDTLDSIFKIIKTYPLDNLIQKHFYDIPE